MNKVQQERIANEAVAVAEAGSQVAILGQSLIHAAEFFAIAEAVQDGASRVCKSNGAQHITFPSGGRVGFYSFRSPARGQALDRAYVPSDIDKDAMAALLPSFDGRDSGEIVAYF